MFHLLKVRTSIDIFSTEMRNVTFGLKYIHVNAIEKATALVNIICRF